MRALLFGVVGRGKQVDRLGEAGALGLGGLGICGGCRRERTPAFIPGTDDRSVPAFRSHNSGGFKLLVGPGDRVGSDAENPGKVPDSGQPGPWGNLSLVCLLDDVEPELFVEGHGAAVVGFPFSGE
jgi:hypothetical protein